MTIFQRGKKRIAAVLCALGLGAAASAASAQTVDLVANNAGPSTSAAGAAFTYVVRLSNNWPGGCTWGDLRGHHARRRHRRHSQLHGFRGRCGLPRRRSLW